MTPVLTFAFEARVAVGRPVDIASSGDGAQRIIPIRGGSVDGPMLKGEVLAGGADWQTIRADGTIELEARYVIRTVDGVAISVVNRGFRHGPPGVLERIAAGEAVDATEYYFRTSPVFRAPPGAYEWMSRTIFVGVGERSMDQVVLKFWSVG